MGSAVVFVSWQFGKPVWPQTDEPNVLPKGKIMRRTVAAIAMATLLLKAATFFLKAETRPLKAPDIAGFIEYRPP
jgi:hypothetical protein